MILNCPECDTHFFVDPAELGAGGRRVRCGRCGHTWMQSGISDEPSPALPGTIGPGSVGLSVSDEPVEGDPIQPLRLGDQHSLVIRPAVPRTLLIGWAGLIALMMGLGAVGLAARDAIIAAWPPILVVYEAIGLGFPAANLIEADADMTGLDLREIAPEFAESGSEVLLRVRGRIANVAADPLALPELRATLLDHDDRPLQSWVFQPGLSQDSAAPPGTIWLEPGRSVPFETSLNGPAPTAARLEIAIAGTAR